MVSSFSLFFLLWFSFAVEFSMDKHQSDLKTKHYPYISLKPLYFSSVFPNGVNNSVINHYKIY